MDGAKVTVPEAVWAGHVAPSAVQQAAMDQRSEDSARGGKMLSMLSMLLLLLLLLLVPFLTSRLLGNQVVPRTPFTLGITAPCSIQ